MVGRQGLSHRRGHNIGGSEVGHVQMIRQRDDGDQGAPKKIWWMKCHTLGKPHQAMENKKGLARLGNMQVLGEPKITFPHLIKDHDRGRTPLIF